MNRFLLLIAFFFCVLLIGCGTEFPRANSSGLSDKTASGSESGTSTDVQNSSNNQNSTLSDSKTAVTAQPPKATPGEADDASLDPLIEGLEFPNVDIQKLLSDRRSAYETSPEDLKAVSEYISLISSLGAHHSRQGDDDKAYAAYERAGEILEKAVSAGVQFPPRLMAPIYYNCACARSRAGKTNEALTCLTQAIQNGFSDLSMIQEDGDLEAVRKLPAFSELLSGWEAQTKANLMEDVRSEITKFESFPFDFSLPDVTGNQVSLAALRGKVCIIDLWGTWCPPCRAEIPSFIRLQEKYAAAGFQIVGLNEERVGTEEIQTKKVRDFIASNNMNYPCALVTPEVKGQIPKLRGYPTTLFIDRTGKVRLVAVGMHKYGYLEAVVEALIEEPAPDDADTPESAAAATREAAAEKSE